MGKEHHRGASILAMKKCLILVEGQTEERFVMNCLRPHLQTQGIWAIPKIITTKRVKAGPNRRRRSKESPMWRMHSRQTFQTSVSCPT